MKSNALSPVLFPHRQQEADDGHAGGDPNGEAADVAHSHDAALTSLAHVEQGNRDGSLSTLRLGAKHLAGLRKTPCALAKNRSTCKSMTFHYEKAIA